ncbi:MAG: ribosome silencing factor [Bacteroidaceae bacterium]|nr:ribosome silencing factor [Bacteroidaceae bacterium]
MIRNKEIKSIIKGIEDKKGRRIRVIDLRKIEDTICSFLVICEGGSPNQVRAIADSVEEVARKEASIKPVNVNGLSNGIWVAMDYSDIIVHIFLPEDRAFYDLDHLWEDGKVYDIKSEE